MAYNGETLGDIDVTLPNGAAETQASLDDAQRELRGAWKTTIAVEHSLAGEHDFPSGATADQPATPVTGQFFFNTDTKRWQRYSGSAWVDLLVYQPQCLPLVGATYDFSVPTGDSPAHVEVGTTTRAITRTRVYFYAGAYKMRGSAYIEDGGAFSNANSYLDIEIATVSPVIVITSDSGARGDKNVSSSSAASLTIPSDGWYTVQLNSKRTAGGGVAVRAASLYWEPV